ncbi:diguanylate cyclase [Alteromonas sp. KUL49]|nr:diguanylate cyclase [Alteromonas sp. KUL49]
MRFVLPHTDGKGAKIKAEQIRNAIQELELEHEDNAPYGIVTISIGIATFAYSREKLKSLDSLIDSADQALYRAKAEGRNRSVHIDD